MDQTNNKDLPWQNYPEKFIQYVSKFEDTKDDFERLIGYLLLDVGVETLLKAYVLADSSLKYEKREASAKGMVGKDTISESKITSANFDKITFHNLIETVKLAAKSKITDEELNNAEHYHGIRNIIYHEGRKTIPSAQDFKNYLTLAKSLLHNLFGVEQENQDKNTLDDLDEALDSYYYSDERIRGDFGSLRHNVEIAVVLIRPHYATSRFQDKLNELGLEADALSSIPSSSSSYQIVEAELTQKFNELTRTKITDSEFIKQACFDATYLQLAVLLSKLQEDVFSELKKYVEFRDFVENPFASYDQITQKDKEKFESFYDWVSTTKEKINSWFESNISKT